MAIPFFSSHILSMCRLTPKQKQLYLLFTFLIHISYFSCVSGQCLNDQRSLLLELKNTLIYCSSYSTKLVHWNQSTDCCNWNGVECDSFGHVTGLELDNEAIYGGIEKSNALYSFRYLENLNLAHNNFKDLKIPRELGNLTNLARLNLSFAEFAGRIPNELSQMKTLAMLDLSRSSYGLGYPNLKNFIQNLTKLEELYLDWVDFKHKRDWWEALSLALPNLRSLSLSNCGLSGRLSSSFLQLRTLSVLRLDGNYLSDTALDFFSNFRNLTILRLGNCSLEGTFPARIFQVPTLQYLDLSFNFKLTGTIPEFQSGGSLSNLSTIDISECNFSGPIPFSIRNLWNLVHLDFSQNSFTGQIPSTIGNLSNLVHLDFSRNSFTGQIPSSIGNLSNLVYLDFSQKPFASNCFTGSVPIFSISNRLEYIDLSNNDLNGSLSSAHFEGLSNLQILKLSNNSLTGNIPTSLFTLPSLQILDLSDNKLSGQVNEFATFNSNLEVLVLNGNQLEGLIPKSFFRLKKLMSLDLSFNLFNGTIQLENFQTLQYLGYLHLGYNHLSVSLSAGNPYPQLFNLNLASCNLSGFPSLWNQINMGFLDLSSNKISGDIPNWIWEIGNGSLRSLNLSNNFLTNLQTPYLISGNLNYLDLHSNMLHCELPRPGRSIEYVDYSNNQFHGHIPNDIGRYIPSEEIADNNIHGGILDPAMFCSVANNSLTGAIPISFCNATNIELIDLSDNLLSGGLPPCLAQNLKALGVLNIARNNISGYIPDTFPIDCSLRTLDLSGNNLRGNIPPSLTNCRSLQVLNVASNSFSGTFPCNLMNLSSLHVLVLRSNKFFGDIRCHGFVRNWSNLQIVDIAFNIFTGIVDPGFISSLTGMKLKNSPGLTGDPLSFQSFFNRIYYRDTVIITMKGLKFEFMKILTILNFIDFSSNKFQGAIPETFGQYSSLFALNLSHNSFTGTIPKSLGNLTNLESLGLSANQLTGNIPTELVSLTFLSFFDVSYNELVGRIPSGSQFGTFPATSYEGNLGLCGSPINRSCDSSVPTEASTTRTGAKDVDWLFMLVGLGYAVGVAFVVLPPLFSRRWGDRWEEIQVKLIQSIFPAYRA